MLKRRTSKRFVLGDSTSEDASAYENDEATETLPNLMKFQMTLDAEPETGTQEEKPKVKEDGKLLRLPNATLT